MNWTAQITKIERVGNILNIVVNYARNDGNTFIETFAVNNVQSDSWLGNQITDRLKRLSDLDQFEQIVAIDPVLNATLSIDANSQTLTITPIAIITPPIDILPIV